MRAFVAVTAGDGHQFQAYVANPREAPRGALVVLQEIFGVNGHMRTVVDSLAAEGYVCIAPCLFDRIRGGIVLDHTPSGIEEGIGYAMRLEPQNVVADIAAALEFVKDAGRAGVVGFCLGGQLAYRAACVLPIACAVSYYGGNIPALLDQKPRCPVMYHFGERDKYIPLSDVEKIRRAHPEGIFHVYAAGHGFASDDRPAFDAVCAELARRRTLDFFARCLT